MKIIGTLINATRGLDAANRFLLQECGKEISLTELFNLAMVFRYGGSGLAQTARQLQISAAGMTGAMDSMERKGLAVRSRHEDRRKVQANMTERGMKVLRIASDAL